MVKKLRLRTRVSQFSFKKSFASKRNLAKQQQFRFVSLQFRETTKKFRFVPLRKFRFIWLKKRFASVVSLKKGFALETVLLRKRCLKDIISSLSITIDGHR